MVNNSLFSFLCLDIKYKKEGLESVKTQNGLIRKNKLFLILISLTLCLIVCTATHQNKDKIV